MLATPGMFAATAPSMLSTGGVMPNGHALAAPMLAGVPAASTPSMPMLNSVPAAPPTPQLAPAAAQDGPEYTVVFTLSAPTTHAPGTAYPVDIDAPAVHVRDPATGHGTTLSLPETIHHAAAAAFPMPIQLLLQTLTGMPAALAETLRGVGCAPAMAGAGDPVGAFTAPRPATTIAAPTPAVTAAPLWPPAMSGPPPPPPAAAVPVESAVSIVSAEPIARPADGKELRAQSVLPVALGPPETQLFAPPPPRRRPGPAPVSHPLTQSVVEPRRAPAPPETSVAHPLPIAQSRSAPFPLAIPVSLAPTEPDSDPVAFPAPCGGRSIAEAPEWKARVEAALYDVGPVRDTKLDARSGKVTIEMARTDSVVKEVVRESGLVLNGVRIDFEPVEASLVPDAGVTSMRSTFLLANVPTTASVDSLHRWARQRQIHCDVDLVKDLVPDMGDRLAAFLTIKAAGIRSGMELDGLEFMGCKVKVVPIDDPKALFASKESLERGVRERLAALKDA
ncbi:hypothetical protein GGF32_005196 [Allomyces javanicus]|nr:hypothetical protein GGF32_005196 [Allomyces javanicus]